MLTPAKLRTQPKYRLPSFLVIGAMKAGTTSLYNYLRPHPEVFMPRVKELNFFQEERNWRRGLGWYVKQFRDAGPEAIAIGEASPGYTAYPNSPGVPERIAAHLPEVRLIYIVRDPIERIRSQYQHRVTIGVEKDPFERAVLQNPNYVHFTRYAFQIEQYLPYVPRDRLLVITSESLRSDRSATMRRVYRFLEVAPDFVPPTLDQEFFRTQSRPEYPPAVWGVWRTAKRWIPGTRQLKKGVDRIRTAVRSPVSEHPIARRWDGWTVPDDVRRILEHELRDDVRRLREYLPPGFDGWGLL